MSKTLILMRHAKSDWRNPSLSDFERPLNKRGMLDAHKMGHWLADATSAEQPATHKVDQANVILCSSARRAQQTLQLILLEMPNTPLIESLDALYLASKQTLLSLLKRYFIHHHCVMLIGHNPGLDSVLQYYCPNAPRTANGKLMTTANIGIIQFDDLLNPTLHTLKRPKTIE